MKSIYSNILFWAIKLNLIVILVLLVTITTAQTKIVSIDGAYVERTTHNCANLMECDSAQVTEETHFLKITETSIKDGDVIAFEITGFNDFMLENKKLLKNVIL